MKKEVYQLLSHGITLADFTRMVNEAGKRKNPNFKISKSWIMKIVMKSTAPSFAGFNLPDHYKEAIAEVLGVGVRAIAWQTKPSRKIVK